jgi:chromosome partitioning protein
MPHLVRQCTRFAQASSEGKPIFLFDRDSKGAHDIQQVITEVLDRVTASNAAKAAAQPAAKSA